MNYECRIMNWKNTQKNDSMTRVKFIIMMLIMPFLASAQSIDAESSYVKFGVSNLMVRTVNGTIK